MDESAVRLEMAAVIASPEKVLSFARHALSIGVDAIQAYALADLYAWRAFDATGDVEPEDIDAIGEPSEGEWRALFGKRFNLKAAEDLAEKLIDADSDTT